jgi:uncharacterized protein (DUF2062 family)
MGRGFLFTTRARLHQLFREAIAAHVEPPRIAAALVVGCMVGATPLFGFHLTLCLGLAWLLRLNSAVMYAGAHISLPPLIPFVGLASISVGERLLHGRWPTLPAERMTASAVHALAGVYFIDWLVGGLVVGFGVGAVLGLLAYAILRARQRRSRSPIELLLEEAAARYRGLHPRYAVYARLKYRLDPVYRSILPLLPPGSLLVDLGTGLGMLPVAAVLLGEGRRAHGIEWDAGKVAAGRHAAAGIEGLTLVDGDARTAALPTAEVVTLVDMLHYYDADTQRALLRRCREALAPGGRLIIREGDGERRGGAAWTRWVEAAMVRWGWNRGPMVRFRPARELRADLESLGLVVRVDEVAGRAHPGNVLFVAEVPGPNRPAVC